MDVPEWMSGTSPVVWKALRFSTIVVSVLGILGNVSSVAVLWRHLGEIPGSRLLLALGIADLGVVTAVVGRILAYVEYGYSQLTRVLEWWFLYCYYCSVYLTILLSVDRYLHTAKSMLLLRINYRRIQKRAVAVVLGVMLVITLPHLLGNFIKYHGFHRIKFTECDLLPQICRSLLHRPKLETFIELHTCNDTGVGGSWLNASVENLPSINDFVRAVCYKREKLTSFIWACYRNPINMISVPTQKSESAMVVSFNSSDFVSACPQKADYMRHDPDFVKAVYLGIDLPLRYIIPCITLGIVNTQLILAVQRVQWKHAAITRAARASLFSLPMLKVAAMIVTVFVICHTGGSAIFFIDINRFFHSRNVPEGDARNLKAVWMEESTHTQALVFNHLAFLLASFNSSVNVLIYCFFLPVFRRCWKRMFWPITGKKEAEKKTKTSKAARKALKVA